MKHKIKLQKFGFAQGITAGKIIIGLIVLHGNKLSLIGV